MNTYSPLIDCKTTYATQTLSSNDTVLNVPSQNKNCIFPFTYKGEEYTACTTKDTCLECFWCGTDYIVTNSKGWGMCNETCKMDNDGKKHVNIYGKLQEIFYCR